MHSRAGTPPPPAIPERLAAALLGNAGGNPPPPERELELDAAFTFSPREVLQAKDFATMSAEELAQVRAMLAKMELPLPRIRLRRTDGPVRVEVVPPDGTGRTARVVLGQSPG